MESQVLHYKILGKLGEGGMGVVYNALDTKLHRQVALKFFPAHGQPGAEELARFVNEARAAAALDHPNICTVYEINEVDGKPFIAMAYVEGQSLQQLLDRASGPVAIADVVDYAIQISSGLQAAHEKSVVHRDIKPGNIMLTEGRQVKITDFGLAKVSSRSRITRVGSYLGGTAAYMSPEQAQGGDVDGRTDLWALGVIMYELLTGHRPFEADHEQAVLYSIVHEEPKLPSAWRQDIPRELETVILKSLVKDPASRYQLAADMLSDLKSIQSGAAPRNSAPKVSKVAPPRPEAEERQKRFGSVMRWLAGAVVLGLVTLALAFRIVPLPFLKSHATGFRSIVILPFANLGVPDDEYFTDGISDEITSRLAMIPALRVIGWTSAMQFRNSTKSAQQIGAELGVNYILTGAVRWDKSDSRNPRVRITPELLSSADGTSMWSNVYDRVLKDIFAVQTDVAQRVLQELDIQLDISQQASLSTPPTRNMDAYNAYLRGLYYLNQPDIGSSKVNINAREMFERATSLDPNFAQAFACLSLVHSEAYHEAVDRTEARIDASRQALEKAFAINPDLGESFVALGYYHYWIFRNYDSAMQAFEQAQAHLPNNEQVALGMGFIRRRQGRYDEAASYLKHAAEISPKSANCANQLAQTYLIMRRYDAAQSEFQRSINLDPDQWFAYEFMIWVPWLWHGDLVEARRRLVSSPMHRELEDYLWVKQDLFEGKYDTALARLNRNPTFDLNTQWWIKPNSLARAEIRLLKGDSAQARPDLEAALVELQKMGRDLVDDDRLHSALGIVYAGLGRVDDAVREGKAGVEADRPAKDCVVRQIRQEELAQVYVMVHKYDEAIALLSELVSAPAHFISVHTLNLDPRWTPLRDHAGFKALLERKG